MYEVLFPHEHLCSRLQGKTSEPVAVLTRSPLTGAIW